MSAPGPDSGNMFLMVPAAIATAFFWGVYGPLLTWGHKAMAYDGRLRPFICVGIAYLVVAIIAPVLLIQLGIMEKGDGLFSGWKPTGTWWSLVAGGAGAMGALFLLIALNYAPTTLNGAKVAPPLLVMPLVFGFAPVINTIFTMWTRNDWKLNPLFLAGLILVGVGAVTVLIGANITWGSPASTKEPPSAKKPIEEKLKEEVSEEKAATENQ